MHLFWLAAVLHTKPVWKVHTEVPHRHSALLAKIPAVCAHNGGCAHVPDVLDVRVHRNPDAAVHPVPPHKQASVFDVAPLVCVQSDAATHRQNFKSESMVHDAVEVKSVL